MKERWLFELDDEAKISKEIINVSEENTLKTITLDLSNTGNIN